MGVAEIRSSELVGTDNADNALATATLAAASGGAGAVSVYVTGVAGGYSATASGKTLILKQGTTEIQRWYVYDSLAVDFSSPIRLKAGQAANLELEASGSASVIGAATIKGYRT